MNTLSRWLLRTPCPLASVFAQPPFHTRMTDANDHIRKAFDAGFGDLMEGAPITQQRMIRSDKRWLLDLSGEGCANYCRHVNRRVP